MRRSFRDDCRCAGTARRSPAPTYPNFSEAACGPKHVSFLALQLRICFGPCE